MAPKPGQWKLKAMAPKPGQWKLKAMASPNKKRKRVSPPSSSESKNQYSSGSSRSSGEEEETSIELEQQQKQKQVLASATNDNTNEESSEDDDDAEDEDQQEKQEEAVVPASAKKQKQVLASVTNDNTNEESSEDDDDDDGEDEDHQEKQEAAAVAASSSAKKQAVSVSQYLSDSKSAKKGNQAVASPGSSAAAWKKEDEEVLLQALDEHHKKYGKLPSQSGYNAMLPALQNRLSFAATATQIYNKVRNFKSAHNKLLSMSLVSKPFTEEQKQRFRLCCKWFGNDTEKAGDDEDENIPLNYSCICKILEKAGKNVQLSELLACANPDTIAKLIGLMQAGELEAKLKKFKHDQMKLKAREMKLHSEVVDVFVRALAKS